jgi:hypothetical protein
MGLIGNGLVVLLVLVASSTAALADDLVLLANGGRVRGTVIEADPNKVVVVKLEDGSTRQFAPAEVADIRYGDGAIAQPVPPTVQAPPPPAQPPPVYYAPAPTPYYPAPVNVIPGAPRARTGFQMALRLGAAFPAGAVNSTALLSDFSGNQFGGMLEIGGKPNDRVFFGMYFGATSGGVGRVIQSICDSDGLSCSSSTGRLGAEVLYSLQPDASINPWIGYGAGFSVATTQFVDTGRRADLDIFGVEWAHLLGGVDFRLNEGLGLGVFMDLSLGTFYSAHNSLDDTTADIPGENQRTHFWLNLGARGILFP